MSSTAHLEMANQGQSSAIDPKYDDENVGRLAPRVQDLRENEVYLEAIDPPKDNYGEDKYNTIPYYVELVREPSTTKQSPEQPPPQTGIRPVTIVVGILAGILLLAFLTAILALAADAFVILKDENAMTAVPLNSSTTTSTTHSNMANQIGGSCSISLRSYGFNDNDTQYCSIKVNGVTYFHAIPSTGDNNTRGVITMILNPFSFTGSVISQFDTCCYVDGGAANLSNYINSLDVGTVLVGVTCDDARLGLGDALGTLQSAGISVSDVDFRGKFAFVLIKGFPFETILAKAMSGGGALQVSVTLQDSLEIEKT